MKTIAVKLFVIACLAFALASCNNDEVAPGETNEALLTRISGDGITELEIFYDIGKNLYRVNYYFGGTLSSYTIYDYDENGIKELRRYDANDYTLEYRTVFTLDNFGRIIKGENYSLPDFENVASISEFSYNTSGQLITREFRSAGQPLYSLEEFAYDDQGNRITQQRTLYPGQPGEYMSSNFEYIPGDQPIPDHWIKYVLILGISGIDEGIREMFNASAVSKAWNSDQELYIESSLVASGHEFNNNGNLTRLVLTRKNILNPENPDKVWEMTYEYAE